MRGSWLCLHFGSVQQLNINFDILKGHAVSALGKQIVRKCWNPNNMFSDLDGKQIHVEWRNTILHRQECGYEA